MKRAVVVLALVLAGCRLDEAGTNVTPAGLDPGPPRAPPAQGGAVPPAPPAPPPPAPGIDRPTPPPPPPPDAAPPPPAPAPPPPPAPAPPPPSAPPAPPPAPGAVACPDSPDLIFCARFEGAAVDESPSRLRIEGSAVRYLPGPSGLAAELAPGRDFRVAETPILDAQTITLEAAVRPAALGRAMTVVENPGQYGLVILPSGAVICGAGSGRQVLAGDAVSSGRWTRLHCVLTDETITLWVDGEVAADGDSAPLQTDRNFGLRIGWDDDPIRPYSGLIDEVRVWRTARPLDDDR